MYCFWNEISIMFALIAVKNGFYQKFSESLDKMESWIYLAYIFRTLWNGSSVKSSAIYFESLKKKAFKANFSA